MTEHTTAINDLLLFELKDIDGSLSSTGFPIPRDDFIGLFRDIRAIRSTGVNRIVRFYFKLANVLRDGGVAPEHVIDDVSTIIEGFEHPPIEENERYDNDTLALVLTYHLLDRHSISYEQAAQIASKILGHEVSRATWRRRVTRWAERKDLAEIVQRKRRTE